jgi:hypothetical protein
VCTRRARAKLIRVEQRANWRQLRWQRLANVTKWNDEPHRWAQRIDRTGGTHLRTEPESAPGATWHVASARRNRRVRSSAKTKHRHGEPKIKREPWVVRRPGKENPWQQRLNRSRDPSRRCLGQLPVDSTRARLRKSTREVWFWLKKSDHGQDTTDRTEK